MTELILSANAAFLVLWCLFNVLALLVWPWLRRLERRFHPDQVSQLLLIWFALPLVLALLLSLLLYSPLGSNWLVASHCHGTLCGEHVPLGIVPGLGLLALLVTLSVLISLAISAYRALRQNRRLLNLLAAGAQRQRDYWTLQMEQATAFTVGFWRPTVVVSQGLLAACDQRDIDILLAHEFAHRRRRDNLRVLLMGLLTLTLPGPIRAKIRDHFRLTVERSCDLSAARSHSKVAVADAIVKVARLCHVGANTVTSAFANHHVESRVHFLLNPTPPRASKALWLALLAALAIGTLLLVTPLHHELEQVLRLFAK